MTPEQTANAAIIADVARAWGFYEYGALLGVMCAIGESSLRNIDYGDRETNGVRNPDGSPTSSIGLFQQQAWWGSARDRMDPRYAAWKFFEALAKVPNWWRLTPTRAIHAVQINADPNHYARFEADARAVLADVAAGRARGTIMANPYDIIELDWAPGNYGRRVLVEALIAAGRPPVNDVDRLYDDQLQARLDYEAGRGNPADDPRYPDRYQLAHVRLVAADIDATPERVRRLEAAGLVRPYSYEPWHWQVAGNIKVYPLVTSIPSSASTPRPPTEEEEIMGVRDDIVRDINTKIGTLDTRRDTAVVEVDGNFFVVDHAAGTKWNAIRGQSSVEEAFRYIGWLRDLGITRYDRQASFTLAGYVDITDMDIDEQIAAGVRAGVADAATLALTVTEAQLSQLAELLAAKLHEHSDPATEAPSAAIIRLALAELPFINEEAEPAA